MRNELLSFAALMTGFGFAAANASAATVIVDNEGAFTNASVVDLTAEGTLGWLTWNASGNPSSGQVQKASPTTPITFTEVQNGVAGSFIPNAANGGWSSSGQNHIDRSWTDGLSPVSGSAGDVGPNLNKYDPAAESPPIYLRFEIDFSDLAVGSDYEANFYFSTQQFDVEITAEQLNSGGALIAGETASSEIGSTSQTQEYSSFTISGTVASGTETLRLTILPDDRGGASHNFRMSSLTVAVPEPGIVSLLALGGLALLGRRRR